MKTQPRMPWGAMLNSSRSFRPLPQEDVDEIGVDGREKHGRFPTAFNSPSRRSLRFILFVLLFFSAIISLGLVSLIHPSKTPQFSSCGTSKTTALQRNCSFDIISFAWQLPACYDAPLINEFIAYNTTKTNSHSDTQSPSHPDYNSHSESNPDYNSRSDSHLAHSPMTETPTNSNSSSFSNWTFYADPKFQHPVPLSTAVLGETNLYVKWTYHVVHCTFMWRQMHRAYENGWIDAHLANYHHTMHCQKMMLMDGRQSLADGRVTVARVIFPECRRVRH